MMTFTRGGLALLLAAMLIGCSRRADQSSIPLWVGNPHTLLTDEEITTEVGAKLRMLDGFLQSNKLDGMMLTQVRNVYWITAGTANNQIVLNKDVGAASLLLMKDGRKYLVCNGAEAGRMMDGGLRKLGYELRPYSWYEANSVVDVRGGIIKDLARGGRIGSDAPYPGTVLVADQFKPLRFSMTDQEIKRYRWLGHQATQAVAEVCRAIAPGMTEYQIEALTSDALRARGILPTVLLTAVDDRILKYRHALPGGDTLKQYAMVNVVAEKWGMPVAVTRFVHFGPLPEDLKSKFERVARVNAHYEAATLPGTSCGAIFEQCKTWYAEAGVPDEWKLHHQGGAIGYDDREYVIYPNVPETVRERQAFAWNPTITGAKVENTILTFADHTEVITASDGWPTIRVDLNGKTYEEPGVLIR